MKGISTMAAQLANRINQQHYVDAMLRKVYYAAQREVLKWIKIEAGKVPDLPKGDPERPDISIDVLVSDGKYVDIGHYDYLDNCFFADLAQLTPTHYRLIGDLPKDEE